MTSFNINKLIIAVNRYKLTNKGPSKEELEDILKECSLLIEFFNDGFIRLMRDMHEYWIEILDKYEEQGIDVPDSMIRILEYLDKVNRIIISRARSAH